VRLTDHSSALYFAPLLVVAFWPRGRPATGDDGRGRKPQPNVRLDRDYADTRAVASATSMPIEGVLDAADPQRVITASC